MLLLANNARIYMQFFSLTSYLQLKIQNNLYWSILNYFTRLKEVLKDILLIASCFVFLQPKIESQNRFI